MAGTSVWGEHVDGGTHGWFMEVFWGRQVVVWAGIGGSGGGPIFSGPKWLRFAPHLGGTYLISPIGATTALPRVTWIISTCLRLSYSKTETCAGYNTGLQACLFQHVRIALPMSPATDGEPCHIKWCILCFSVRFLHSSHPPRFSYFVHVLLWFSVCQSVFVKSWLSTEVQSNRSSTGSTLLQFHPHNCDYTLSSSPNTFFAVAHSSLQILLSLLTLVWAL